MSRMFYNPRVILVAISFMVGGAAFCLFLYWGLGWWWDGFFLFLFGLLMGQLIGYTIVLAFVPNLWNSEGLAIFPGAGCALSMAARWLCLPENLVTVLGHIAMT